MHRRPAADARYGVNRHMTRLRALIALVVMVALTSCGGSDGGASGPAIEGSIEARSITSQVNRTRYPLDIYLPPASAGSRANLPVVYALDGEWRFAELVRIVEATRARVIVVAIGNQASRNRDYVPPNNCTADGGGHAAFLLFIRSELIPFVEGTIGGHADKRILLGHSHGGSFVFYALFAEAAQDHQFASYLASDASIGCMPPLVNGWLNTYSAGNTSLPVRLHVSYGPNIDNIPFAQQIRDAAYTDLTLQAKAYDGGHNGMIPAAFSEGIAFALAP